MQIQMNPQPRQSGLARTPLILGLIVMLVLVAACGGNPEPTPTPIPAAPTEAAAPAATEAPTVEPTAAAEEAATPSAFESPLQAVSPLALPAIAPVSPLPTPPSVAAEDGAIVGRVISLVLPGNPPLDMTTVKVGKVQWREDGSDGDFAIDAARGPSAVTQPDGTFVLNNLPPGDYVMVVGDLIGRHQIMTTEDGKAQVFAVAAGEVTDAGNIFVDLP